MSFGATLAGIPGGYSAEQTAEVARELKRQQILLDQQNRATIQRQAPLQDQLLQAQIKHLGQPNQYQQQRNDDLAAFQAMQKFGGDPRMQSIPQPPQPGGAPPGGPNPFQGAT